MGPGEPWERIFTGPGMMFFKKIPVGKDPGNCQGMLSMDDPLIT